MITNQNITDTVGYLALCLNGLKTLKEQLGNPNRINFQTHHDNIRGAKNSILFSFQQYQGSRKTYNHDIIEIEDTLVNLEKDFIDIFSLVGEPSNEQITQLEGIIYKIQKLIVEKIQNNSTYYQQLKENFPNHF